jgi:hypothetical protein
VTVAGNRRLVIEIVGNARDAAKAFGDVRKQSDVTKERLDRFGTAALGAGVAIAGGLAFAVKEFVAADEESRKLDNSIKNSTNSFSRGGDAVRELTTELQNLSGADGDALVGASSLAVQWGLSESQISSLLPLVNDLALKMGVDVNSAMKAVLKSTDGSSTALRKMGIDVDATKLKADPFASTMDALKGSVGGFGEEVGKTSAGQLNILKAQLGDLVEAVGGGTLDVFGPVISGLTNFINGAGPAGQAAGDMAGKVLAVGSAGLIAVGGIVKIAGAVKSAKDALTTADGALNNFGRTAQVVGGIAAGIAIYGLLDQIDNATKNAVGLQTALDRLSTAKTPQAMLEAFKKAHEDSTGILGDILRLGDIATDPFEGMQVSVAGSKEDINTIQQTLSQLKDTGDTEALAQAMVLLTQHTKGGGKEMAALAGVLKPYQDAAKAATTRTKEQAGAHEEAANAADEQNAALKALTDPVFGAMRAQQQNTAAQEKYAEAQNKVTFLMKAGMTRSSEFATAQRELQSASIDAGSSAVNQQTALASLGGAMQNGTVSADGLSSTLDGLVASGALSRTAAEQLGWTFRNSTATGAMTAAGGINGVGAAARGVDGKTARVSVTADTATAQFKIDGFSTSLRNLVLLASTTGVLSPGFKAKVDATLAGRATGGTVRGDRPYLVGERGPEIVVPGSGYVIPTRRLVDQQPAMAGGGGITVNVTAGVGDPVAIGRTVVESLKAYERTNGTTWRN